MCRFLLKLIRNKAKILKGTSISLYSFIKHEISKEYMLINLTITFTHPMILEVWNPNFGLPNLKNHLIYFLKKMLKLLPALLQKYL